MLNKIIEPVIVFFFVFTVIFVITFVIEIIKEDPMARRKRLMEKLTEDQEKREKYLTGE